MVLTVRAEANSNLAHVIWRPVNGQVNETWTGFAVHRCTAGAPPTIDPLPNPICFQDPSGADPTDRWRIQDFEYWDREAPLGKSLRYHVTPLTRGQPVAALPDPAVQSPLWSQPVALTPGSGKIKAYFNRGIVAQ
ncbi:MAG TPA: hypothetical protein VFX49_03840, partial [Chloroflexota bacterium]|nr:hypothetical protein [Chloroflexota bacterium]